MNLRNVLRAYSLLRQFTDDESALLETLRAATDTERALLVDTLSDKPQKKAGKKAAGGGGRSTGKSQRAAGLGSAIDHSLSQRRQETIDDVVQRDAEEPPRCQSARADGNPCKLLPDHNIHHLATAHEYHEFQSPVSNVAGASGD